LEEEDEKAKSVLDVLRERLRKYEYKQESNEEENSQLLMNMEDNE